MTACLYISPPHDPDVDTPTLAPAMLADTMATLSHPPAGAQPVLPAHAFGSASMSTVRMCRKLVLIENGAFALAGDGALIRQCIHEIRMQLADWLKEDRPLRPLGDIAQRIGIEALAVVVMPDNQIWSISPQAKIATTRHLGMCRAVGSGAERLLEQCAEFDHIIAHWPTGTVVDKVVGFTNGINARRLAAEFMGDAEARKSWGGYVEWAAFEYSTMTWTYGPPTLHMFYYMVPTNQGTVKFVRAPFTLMFDPINDAVARALALNEEGVREFIFDSVDVIPPSSERSANEFWRNWKPGIAVITFMGTGPNQGFYIPRSLNASEWPDLTFEVSDTTILAGLTPTLLNKLGNELSSRRLFNYEEFNGALA
jgi:hypothetical protein